VNDEDLKDPNDGVEDGVTTLESNIARVMQELESLYLQDLGPNHDDTPQHDDQTVVPVEETKPLISVIPAPVMGGGPMSEQWDAAESYRSRPMSPDPTQQTMFRRNPKGTTSLQPQRGVTTPAMSTIRIGPLAKRQEVPPRNHNGSPWVVALGECGLDQAPGFPPIQDQIPWFRAQVQLAQKLNVPLFVHERLAFEETLHILQEHYQHANPPDATTAGGEDNRRRVVIHCFTGNATQFKEYLRQGYSISLAGGFLAKSATDENAKEICQVLPELWHDAERDAYALQERLMLETDAPYMGFPNCRQWYLQHHATAIADNLTSKKRKRLTSSTYPNVPSSLGQVLDLTCDILNHNHEKEGRSLVTRAELAHMTTRNAKAFFGFRGPPQEA